MYKTVEKIKKHSTHRGKGPYMRITRKMLYLNSDAMRMMPDVEYITMSVDAKGHSLCIWPSDGENANAFKLCRVCETPGARRIETNNSLESIIKAGFPVHMLGERLPVSTSFSGCLNVDFRPHIPFNEKGEKQA